METQRRIERPRRLWPEGYWAQWGNTFRDVYKCLFCGDRDRCYGACRFVYLLLVVASAIAFILLIVYDE